MSWLSLLHYNWSVIVARFITLKAHFDCQRGPLAIKRSATLFARCHPPGQAARGVTRMVGIDWVMSAQHAGDGVGDSFQPGANLKSSTPVYPSPKFQI